MPACSHNVNPIFILIPMFPIMICRQYGQSPILSDRRPEYTSFEMTQTSSGRACIYTSATTRILCHVCFQSSALYSTLRWQHSEAWTIFCTRQFQMSWIKMCVYSFTVHRFVSNVPIDQTSALAQVITYYFVLNRWRRIRDPMLITKHDIVSRHYD